MSENFLKQYPELEKLLTDYSDPQELAESIDYALFCMVQLLKEDVPGGLNRMLNAYEILFELKAAFLNQAE